MFRIFTFLLGVAGGFVLAHYANRTEQGKRVLEHVDKTVNEAVNNVRAYISEAVEKKSDK